MKTIPLNTEMVVCKYPLTKSLVSRVKLPNEHIILKIEYQNLNLMLWALVNPKALLTEITIHHLTTGEQVTFHNPIEYIGTTIAYPDGLPFVLHHFVNKL